MAKVIQFVKETKDTAAFAVRQYFRPLSSAVRLSKAALLPDEPAGPSPRKELDLDDAKAILHERLARGRHHERILLMQGVISAIVSLLSLLVSLLPAFGLDFTNVLAILVPVSVFAVWVVVRLVRNRETIIELKTIRWIINSVDKETAHQMVTEVLWSMPRKKRRRTSKGSGEQPAGPVPPNRVPDHE